MLELTRSLVHLTAATNRSYSRSTLLPRIRIQPKGQSPEKGETLADARSGMSGLHVKKSIEDWLWASCFYAPLTTPTNLWQWPWTGTDNSACLHIYPYSVGFSVLSRQTVIIIIIIHLGLLKAPFKPPKVTIQQGAAITILKLDNSK